MPSYPNSQTLLLLECFRTVGDQDIKGAECVCVCGGGGVLGGVEKVMMMAPVQPLPPLPPFSSPFPFPVDVPYITRLHD